MVHKVLGILVNCHRYDLSGISVLAAEMPNKSCCALIDIYPGVLLPLDRYLARDAWGLCPYSYSSTIPRGRYCCVLAWILT